MERTLRVRAQWIVVAVAALLTSACSLAKQEEPALAGPSGLGMSVTMSAQPDRLPRDGTSQSVVTLTVRDAQGRAVPGQRLTLALPPSAPAGAGLSTTDITTGAGGEATFAVTAPVVGSFGDIIVNATPFGTDANNARPRSISITAIPTNTTAPTAAFTFTPATPDVGQIVTFDASTTTDEGVACGTCTFIWDFKDGSASGPIVKHAFSSGGTFAVTLTVTDVGGSVGTIEHDVPVTAIGVPTASISNVNPAAPIIGQPAIFTATATASGTHRVVNYNWNWGDGSSETNTTATTAAHSFSNTGRFLVTLTVRDDLGQTMQAFQAVTVSSGLVASFSATQVPPNGNHQMNFDASASVSNTGTTITDYAWDFGDGTTEDDGSTKTATHTYGAAGTYTVKLTITDDKGRTATTSQAVGGGGGGGVVVASVK